MSTPSAIFTEMVTTTLRYHGKELTDNVTNNNALWHRLNKKGRVKKYDGGYEIALPLEYAENGNYSRYSGYDIYPVGAADVATSAKFDWKQSVIPITVSGRELRVNSGKAKLIDLAEMRTKNAMKTGANNLARDCYSAGLEADQIGGLRHSIHDNGLGTVGGIDAATWAFWRSKVQEASGTNTISKSTIKGEMMQLWLKVKRGEDKVDLGLFSPDFFAMFWESLTDQQRYQSDEMAKAGFTSLKFQETDVVHDTTESGITAEHGYMMCTDYLYLVAHPDADLTVGEEQKPVNQDAIVIPIFWMGNMCVTNRARQGVLIDAA